MPSDSFLRDRKNYVIHLLETRSRIETSEVCDLFQIAPSTARKLLDDMGKEGLLIRTYGGAISVDVNRDESLKRKSQMNTTQKRDIARRARALIRDGETIAMAGGTTVLELAKLCMDLKGNIVLTNSIVAANILISNPEIEIRICSGIVRGRTGCVIGPTAHDLFLNIDVDKTFVGADGVDLEKGIYSSNLLVGNVEQAMARSAHQAYVLCDYSKLGANSVMPFLELSEVAGLITDVVADPSFTGELTRRGVQVITAYPS